MNWSGGEKRKQITTIRNERRVTTKDSRDINNLNNCILDTEKGIQQLRSNEKDSWKTQLPKSIEEVENLNSPVSIK